VAAGRAEARWLPGGERCARTGAAMWIDAHCHLDAKNWPEGPDAVLERARAAGVTGFVVVRRRGPGVRAGRRRARRAAARRLGRGGRAPARGLGLRRDLAEIEPLFGRARVVAVGETGLGLPLPLLVAGRAGRGVPGQRSSGARRRGCRW
jgi:hypothetical protein